MEKFLIRVDGKPNFAFVGEFLGEATSSPCQEIDGWWSGDIGRWQCLELYKTRAGNFVCSTIHYTEHTGERTKYEGEVYKTVEEVLKFFGHDWLAKELYLNCKIDESIQVD